MAKFWIRVNLDGHPNHRQKILLILMKLFAFRSEFNTVLELQKKFISTKSYFRKPNTVMAISLLLNELENPEDLDEIKKTLKVRLKKLKETTDIFTV